MTEEKPASHLDSSSDSEDIVDRIAQDFLRQRRLGNAPSIDEFAEQHPQISERLKAVLPALMIIEDVRPAAPSNAAEPRSIPQQIGDYRVIRKLGQGGMGVVYEAEQVALGRRVALKVLSAGVFKDAKLRERFQLEARSAAKLHHTNIVPVFDVGHEGDTSYYAMQFIEGRGLDLVLEELIRLREEEGDSSASAISTLRGEISDHESGSTDPKRRQVFFKSVARLGADVADALSYAHDRNIVHRDVKPSNLLLDNSGVIWLADFGLAKAEDIELTATGDFVGTARYMSPERFQGKGDHRVDIYGLGMTLYEIVTGCKAFDAADRLQLVEQISSSEPRRPRTIDRHLPLDLETIILKAMDKEPRRRYSDAKALAADLRRFCDDQTIAARRPSPVERLWRWTRRNRALAAAIFLMLSLIAVLSASTYEILRQRNAADANLRESQRLQKVATSNLELAREKTELAEENFQKALEAVNTYYTTVSQETLLNEPGMQALRSKLLESASNFYRDFLAERGDDQKLQTSFLEAIYNQAGLEIATGSGSKAREMFKLVLDQLQEDIQDTEDRERLSIFIKASVAYVSALLDIGKSDEVLEYVDRGKTAADRFIALEPTETLPKILRSLLLSKQIAYMANRGDLKEALAVAKTSRNLLLTDATEQDLMEKDYLDELGLSHRMIGAINTGLGNYEESIEHYQASFDSFQSGLQLEPKSAQTRWYASNQLANIALMKNRLADSEACIRYNEQALEILEQLVQDFPLGLSYQEEQAGCLTSLGSAHWETENYLKALECYKESEAIRRKLVEKRPEDTEERMRLARVLQNLTLALNRLDRGVEATEYMREAVQLAKQVCETAPNNPRYKSDLRRLQSDLAGNLADQGDLEQARSILTEAYEQARDDYADNGELVEVGLAVCNTASALAQLVEELGDTEDAADILTTGINVGEATLQRAEGNKQVIRQLEVAYFQQAGLRILESDWQAAAPLLERAIELAPSEFRRVLNSARSLLVRVAQDVDSLGDIQPFVDSLDNEMLENPHMQMELARLNAIQALSAKDESNSSEAKQRFMDETAKALLAAVEGNRFANEEHLSRYMEQEVFEAFRDSGTYLSWLQQAREAFEDSTP